MADTEGYLHYGGELGPLLNAALKDVNRRRNEFLFTNLDLYSVNDTLQRMTAAQVTARFATVSDASSDDLKAAVADICAKLGKNTVTTIGDLNAALDKALARLKIA